MDSTGICHSFPFIFIPHAQAAYRIEFATISINSGQYHAIRIHLESMSIEHVASILHLQPISNPFSIILWGQRNPAPLWMVESTNHLPSTGAGFGNHHPPGLEYRAAAEDPLGPTRAPIRHGAPRHAAVQWDKSSGDFEVSDLSDLNNLYKGSKKANFK